MEYYVLLGKTKAGPYSVECLKARGHWTPNTLVCRNGETEWKRIGELDETYFSEPLVEEVMHRPDPPEKLSREVTRFLALVFPLLIAATLFEEKAEYYYREGNYKLSDKYSGYVHTCVVVAGGLVCVGILIGMFCLKIGHL